MTINALSGSVTPMFSVSQTNATSRSTQACQSEGAESARPPAPPAGGGLAEAIISALSELDLSGEESVTTDAGSASASSSQVDPQSVVQAFGSFMHTLIEALHAQGDTSGTNEAEGISETSMGMSGPKPRHNAGAPGRMEADLQSLIAQVSASTASGSDSTTETADAGDAGSAALQDSFTNLLSAMGISDGDAKLSGFLQSLQSKLDQVGSSGNLLNVTA